MAQVTLKVKGMTCASCVSHVDKALRKVDGVVSADINLATEEARVEVNGAHVQALVKAVESAGYSASPEVSDSDDEIAGDDDSEEHQQASFKSRFLIALPLAALVMVVEMGPMIAGGAWEALTHANLFAVNIIKLTLTAIVLFYAGISFFTRAYKAARHATADMNTLVAVGTGAAFGFSAWATFFGTPDGLISSHDVYFDTAAVIVALVLLGRWMEERAKNHTRTSLKQLLELSPKTAHRVSSDEQIETIPLKQVKKGDILVVKAFETVPVDGVIIEGHSGVDESMMTGESMPVEKTIDDEVIGGTRNTNQVFQMRATKVGAETALAGIIKTVKRSQGSKAPIQRQVDKVAGIFVPVVMVFALITMLVWLFIGTPQQAIVNMVAVLVIACPCALGLATPTAIMVGSGRAAEKGILIKDAVTLEEARNIEVILFDKTGTLTTGDMKLAEIHALAAVDADELLLLAASVEQASDHPIAKSIVVAAKQKGLEPKKGLSIETRAGIGISGLIGSQTIEIGSVKTLSNEEAKTHEEVISKWQEQGRVVLVMHIDRKPSAFIALEDEIRIESIAVVKDLQDQGITVVLLTGDQPVVAKAVANKLGIANVEAGVSPTGKSQIVKKYQDSGKQVAMVGDGINDAAALTQANLGIAMSGGSDLAVSSSDITIMGDDLHKVAESIRFSKRVLHIIRQNLFWAFVYNSVGIPLAAIGLLSPMIAGAAMALSSVSVVTNSLRIKRY